MLQSNPQYSDLQASRQKKPPSGIYVCKPSHCLQLLLIGLAFELGQICQTSGRVKILKHAYPPLIPGTVLPALLHLALALAFALQVLFFLLTLCFALRLSLALTGLRV